MIEVDAKRRARPILAVGKARAVDAKVGPVKCASGVIDGGWLRAVDNWRTKGEKEEERCSVVVSCSVDGGRSLKTKRTWFLYG